MSSGAIQRRRGGPTLAVAVDLVRHARHTRNWVVLVVALAIVLAIALGATSQAAVPFLVYGGL